MKYIFFIFISIFLISCNDNDENIKYLYAIENNTGAKVTDIIIYCYPSDKDRNSGYDRNLTIDYINISDTSKVFETNYPYICVFYAVNELEYYSKFPEKEDFALMDLDKINIITIEKR